MSTIKMELIYSLDRDTALIEKIQEASLDKFSRAGLKIEDGRLFGTRQWVESASNGDILKHFLTGTITSISISGMNDYPEFTLDNTGLKTVWTRLGDITMYKVGKCAQIVYVNQRYKFPIDLTGPISKCVLEIWVER